MAQQSSKISSPAKGASFTGTNFKDTRSRDNNLQGTRFTPKHAGALFGIAALTAYGLIRRTKAGNAAGIATGVALAAAGGLAAFKTAQWQMTPEEYTAKANFLINTTPEKAYQLWRDFSKLPRFMSHLKSVRVLDGERSEWVANGPGNTEVRWNARITDDQPNRRIAWESLPDSDVTNRGWVTFAEGPISESKGQGTMVTAQVNYNLPLGPLAKAMLTMFGKHPEFVVREDLRRFKSLAEAGESPTTMGQTHGPRGIHGRTEEILFRETSNRPDPQVAEAELRRSA